MVEWHYYIHPLRPVGSDLSGSQSLCTGEWWWAPSWSEGKKSCHGGWGFYRGWQNVPFSGFAHHLNKYLLQMMFPLSLGDANN